VLGACGQLERTFLLVPETDLKDSPGIDSFCLPPPPRSPDEKAFYSVATIDSWLIGGSLPCTVLEQIPPTVLFCLCEVQEAHPFFL